MDGVEGEGGMGVRESKKKEQLAKSTVPIGLERKVQFKVE